MERCSDDRQGMRLNNQLASSCINCPWYVSGTESHILYCTNEIVRITGTVTSSPESIAPVLLRFMYRHAVVESLELYAGQMTGFTMIGFDRIEVKGTGAGDAMGTLMIESIESSAG